MVVFAVAVAIAVGVSAALGAYLLLWSVLGAGAVVALLARTPPVRANRLRRRERRRAIERERAARARAERDERRAVRRQVRRAAVQERIGLDVDVLTAVTRNATQRAGASASRLGQAAGSRVTEALQKRQARQEHRSVVASVAAGAPTPWLDLGVHIDTVLEAELARR